ncbi:CDP-alcohol phosphatidyltransferase family protein [Actinomadura rugatobispora]|uniref:CDP-alcohol phosphatidyltransferase family protein n=1 Tax=Actinomadura rugatobispora TaxID=1994 RepID=A0ABW1AFI5_9ACTN|nr:hypothetical protein GCM10010200_057130 [Actinomadura rugatobispora]
MTIALIIATGRVRGRPDPGPAAALPYRIRPGEPADPPTLLARLCDRLATLNVPDVRVIGRPRGASALRADGHFVTECADPAADLREIARTARLAEEPVVVLPADLVADDALLERLLYGSGGPVVAVTVPAARAGAHGTAGVRVSRGRIVAVDTGAGAFTGPDAWTGSAARVNAASPGMLRFDPSRAAEVADVAEGLAGRDPSLTGAGADGTLRGDALVALLAGLVRAGTHVADRPARGLVCRRAADPAAVAEARAELDYADGEGARLAASVKRDDGFFATFAVSAYSPYIVRWVAARGITPDAVTAASVALALLAALWFSGGTRAGMVTGAVLLYLAFVLDCVDGQLARYTGRFSALGAWLDAVSDRVKEYAVYAGLAIGSTAAAAGTSAHGGDVWALAMAALILQTVRHMIDFSYQAHTGADGADGDGTVARWSARTSGVRPLHWAKKILVLPIGERFALIALTAAFTDARVTFLALLIWGGVATAYTLAGRVLRTMTATMTAGGTP